ncbi:MAG: type IV pilin-like G/H family protein [Cyanobacteria bacterium P01_A01_bin.114]
MKSTFTTKLLQHLSKKKQEGGFTLIELLVVIIIIGILAAIALPSFLNQANKAKQSEAKTYVGSMNRAQQAYYLEEDTFANEANFGRLGLGISQDTSNYEYEIDAAVGTNPASIINRAIPDNVATASIRAYLGGVQVGQTANNEATTLAVLCEALQVNAVDNAAAKGNESGATAIDFVATGTAGGPTCGTLYEDVN